MKKILLLLMLVLSLTTNAQDNHLPDIKADISTMLPMKYPPRTGMVGFSLELRNDSAYIYLPYIGEVYNPVYGSDGLNFSEPCQNIKVEKTKKSDGRILSFSLRHDIVDYRFRLTIYDNHSFDLFLLPSNAQSCDYTGEWD